MDAKHHMESEGAIPRLLYDLPSLPSIPCEGKGRPKRMDRSNAKYAPKLRIEVLLRIYESQSISALIEENNVSHSRLRRSEAPAAIPAAT